MKATGIIRRVDQLGRIVVPKEIRKSLRISEGDQVEILVNSENEIILRKFSMVETLQSSADICAQALGQATGHAAVITDKDVIVSVYGAKKDLNKKPISNKLTEKIDDRSPVRASKTEEGYVPVTSGFEAPDMEYIVPIISDGDSIGSVILLTKGNGGRINSTDEAAAKYAATLLGKQLE